MSGAELRVATPDDVDHMAEVLADAFYDDPIFTWLFPDDTERPRLSQGMFRMLGRHVYMPHGESLVGDEVAGYWEPPGVGEADDFWIEHGDEFVTALTTDGRSHVTGRRHMVTPGPTTTRSPYGPRKRA